MYSNVIVFIVCYFLTGKIKLVNISYMAWICNAFIVAIIVFCVLTCVYFITYRKELENIKNIIVAKR